MRCRGARRSNDLTGSKIGRAIVRRLSSSCGRMRPSTVGWLPGPIYMKMRE